MKKFLLKKFPLKKFLLKILYKKRFLYKEILFEEIPFREIPFKEISFVEMSSLPLPDLLQTSSTLLPPKIPSHQCLPPSLFFCDFLEKLFIDPCLWIYHWTRSFSKCNIVPFQAVAMKGKISSDDALLQMRLCSSDNT